MVMGPTPPGTGVIAAVTSLHPAKSASPTNLHHGASCGIVFFSQ